MDSTGRPYALVMQKGSVAPYKLNKKGLSGVRQRALNERAEVQMFESASERVPRRDALERVIAHTPKDSTVVLASTGFCGRELYAIDDRENQVYLVGSMGCVTPMALGLALSRPDLNVVALDGDGAALMRMGVFATLGAYGPANLTHLLLDNGAHESTGGQATVSQGVEFARIASACGYALTLDGDDLSVIDRLFEAKDIDGVRFARLSINTGTPSDLPRPSITPEDVRRRLQAHIGR
jgi:phosphonopyruvate decarboxylase